LADIVEGIRFLLGEPGSDGPVSVFYSYSHRDQDLRARLESHLASLRRSALIREWHDREIPAGADWAKMTIVTRSRQNERLRDMNVATLE
jgi:hypothetical protein